MRADGGCWTLTPVLFPQSDSEANKALQKVLLQPLPHQRMAAFEWLSMLAPVSGLLRLDRGKEAGNDILHRPEGHKM